MFAMTLDAPGQPLRPEGRSDPEPGPGELRLVVRACGVCRTDLHVVDGELAPRGSSVIPGHEVVGVVDAVGRDVTEVERGERRGVSWLGQTCGQCRYCTEDRENLCDAPVFTGWTRDGGYADRIVARAEACVPLPETFSDVAAAPLLCAGLIGYRCWRKAQEGGPVERLGLYGFGAAAHLFAPLAIAPGQRVHAFTGTGDVEAGGGGGAWGCVGAGGWEELPPEPLDAAILFAPVGALVPQALRAVRKAGTVVCGGIHMSDIPSFPYAFLWEERRLVSVANPTPRDAREYLPLAARVGVRSHVKVYPLREANTALADLRRGAFTGAAV